VVDLKESVSARTTLSGGFESMNEKYPEIYFEHYLAIFSKP